MADNGTEPKTVLVERSKRVGALVGVCKWFSDNRGYGFITVCSEAAPGSPLGAGADVFVHFSGLRPLNNHHRKLYKGEYVSFDVVDAEDRQQAVNITGVLGGPLMCDHEYPGSHPPASLPAGGGPPRAARRAAPSGAAVRRGPPGPPKA